MPRAARHLATHLLAFSPREVRQVIGSDIINIMSRRRCRYRADIRKASLDSFLCSRRPQQTILAHYFRQAVNDQSSTFPLFGMLAKRQIGDALISCLRRQIFSTYRDTTTAFIYAASDVSSLSVAGQQFLDACSHACRIRAAFLISFSFD